MMLLGAVMALQKVAQCQKEETKGKEETIGKEAQIDKSKGACNKREESGHGAVGVLKVRSATQRAAPEKKTMVPSVKHLRYHILIAEAGLLTMVI